jgi:hypothetical protein
MATGIGRKTAPPRPTKKFGLAIDKRGIGSIVVKESALGSIDQVTVT